MSRRRRSGHREIEADPLYNSKVIAKFINKVMEGGKKSTARRIVYDAIKKMAEKLKSEDPLASFNSALENAMPSLEVKSRRIGGATYQVPVEMSQTRRTSLGMKWLIAHSRSKPGRSMTDALAAELVDCFNNTGTTIKKKEDTHRMAEANKAFAHYRW